MRWRTNPAVAFQAVLHNFVLATFYRFASSSGCLEIAIRTPTFPAPGARPEGERVGEGHRRAARWLEGAPAEGRGRPLGCAHSARRKRSRPRCSRIAHRSRSMRSTSRPTATMTAGSPPTASGDGSTTPTSSPAPSGSTWSAAGWRPTVDNYLGRVTKPRILEAVREAKGEPVGAAHRPPQEGATWRRKPNGCSMVRAGCPSRSVSSRSMRVGA